jgi:tRNA(Ile)-lysidine synthase
MSSALLRSSVRRAWLDLSDPPPGLVVALSGGPDSVALTRALIAVRPDPAIPLVLAHLNHLLRGPDSDADEAFVIDFHTRLSATVPNLHLQTHRIDVALLARKQSGNLEAVGRRERYTWLAQVARLHSLHHIATGHTASDQAETVLHRLVRGTGIEGLRGIAARRQLEPGIEVVRPLLHVSRDEVLAYLRDIDQMARHDASNDDPHFTRNRIRHELLPLLARDYNPRIVEVLGRLAEQAEEVWQEEERAGQSLLGQAELPRAGPLIILDALVLGEGLPRTIRTALRLVWQREGWPMGEMGFVQWQRLAALVEAQTGAHDLPGGIRARRHGRVLQLGPSERF